MNAHNPSKLAAVSVPLSGVPRERSATEQLDGRGRWELCVTCGHGFYSCICNAPDPDVMPVSDMKRVMPQLFDEPDYGWGLAERSAYGMERKE